MKESSKSLDGKYQQCLIDGVESILLQDGVSVTLEYVYETNPSRLEQFTQLLQHQSHPSAQPHIQEVYRARLQT
ncbi:MAG: hypothetical protein J07HQW2_02653 [Haloquadratum walsbyi J07HQW2]|uniref:Uncharacterized protein n=1 Tax=Haloquadratum walsbyi J07HQW2 TaxID=1238425 RepID=U1PQY9_9EURY|nr:MAG: hypothetical protein J07HQW2_02653 [Haloquadratum walsbyi J07HQW2]